MKNNSEPETKLGNGSKPRGNEARHPKWKRLAGVLLGLLASSTGMRSARAETISVTNNAALTTPDSGQASLYPSNAGFGLFPGKVAAVRVTLHNITHTWPDDYDIMLVGPGGQKAILTSDCGGGNDLNNVTITFSDFAQPLPDSSQIASGTYRPSNYSAVSPVDTFPPSKGEVYSSSLAVFNNTEVNGTWHLYVVDDASGDLGTIAGGWTLELDTTGFRGGAIIIPSQGVAGPYPSQINVVGLLGNIESVRPTLTNLAHTFPDDLDIMLVGPAGQNAIIMSDVGGTFNAAGVTLTLADSASVSLPDAGPLVSGTFKPTNFNDGADTFPAPAPAPAGTSPLSVFSDTSPSGTWKLFVVDDTSGGSGSVADGWSLDFNLRPTILANISTRLPVQTGDNVLIGGFIVTGTQPKKVIVRAIGPSLALAGQLADPTLELRDASGALIRSNDNWRSGDPGFASQESEIILTGVPPTNNLESAIVATLPANNSAYTAIVRGFNNSTGIALVEGYDLDHTVNSKLANISTRGFVQTGDNVLIAGTIVLGGFSQKVIVRAIGPSLPLTGKLANPTLELRDSDGALIGQNDDWRGDQEADILHTGIEPTNELESAIVAVLPSAGASYTAIVRGVGGATGIALVEIYGLN